MNPHPTHDGSDACPLCKLLAACRQQREPRFIHEFEHSVLLVGEHQYHPGYAVLVLKTHVCELHHLPAALATAHFTELMAATRALVAGFSPHKMNHACLGNRDPHLHWHLFPRQLSDPDHLTQPWLRASVFNQHRTDDATARELAVRVREHLPP